MTHLTEEQIDELLMGSLDAEQAASLRQHAATCPPCAAQLEAIEAPIASFKTLTGAWSERRSATLPVRPARRSGVRWGLGFAWGSLAAAALLAAVIPVMRHEQDLHVKQAYNKAANLQLPSQPASTPAPAAQTAPATNDDNAATVVPENRQEIASDNQLLAMVDEELNAPITAPGESRSNQQGSVQD